MKIIYSGDGNEFDLKNLSQPKFPCFIVIGEKDKIFFDNRFNSKFECDIDFETDVQNILDRTESVCGGNILMSGFCMMTLKKNLYDYKVIDFDYFSSVSGWCPVIINEELYEVDFSKPVDNWPRYVPKLQQLT